MTKNTDDAAGELLIKEVDEELRHDQLHQLWKRHGGLLIVSAVGLVLGVAGWQGWNAWQADQHRDSSKNYAEAQRLTEQGKVADAASLLGKLSADGVSGYRILAALEQADLKLKAGDAAGAVGIYEAMAGDSGIDDVYRDLARLKAAYLKLDSADPAAIAKSVEPLAAESSPWRHSAREIQAVAALKQGNADKAAELFRKLADDPAAPRGVKGRAAEMLAATGAKAKG